jgi:hypothetical protein
LIHRRTAAGGQPQGGGQQGRVPFAKKRHGLKLNEAPRACNGGLNRKMIFNAVVGIADEDKCA